MRNYLTSICYEDLFDFSSTKSLWYLSPRVPRTREAMIRRRQARNVRKDFKCSIYHSGTRRISGHLFEMRHVGDPFQVGGNETAPLLELEQGVLQRVQRLLQRLLLLLPVHLHLLLLLLLVQRLLSSRQFRNVGTVPITPEPEIISIFIVKTF